ncbi:MAG: GGDEF domain protein [Idiomarinaceae bacterium HL-53]|nr:MAG: GGDEF domain protein [Idiomarinaceae bacterium HL-53]CUS49210.1 Diguanylate cyclase, GGDEF domain [Idiomarinaceae bacterium HL-53]
MTTKSAQLLLQLAEQMLSMIRGEIQNEELRHYITASIGASLGSQHELSSELMSHAETALYEAKLLGRDQVSFYKERMTSSVVSEYQIEMGLRQALERQEIECWLQSKYNAQYEINGAEALIRWRRYVSTGWRCYGSKY